MTVRVESLVHRDVESRTNLRYHVASHEMRGPAGTGRDDVSIAGRRRGQVAGKGDGARGRRLPSPPCVFFRDKLCLLAFCLDKVG